MGRLGRHKCQSGRSDTGGTDCAAERKVVIEIGTVMRLAVVCGSILDPNLEHIFPGRTRLDPKRWSNVRMRNVNAVPILWIGMTPFCYIQWR